MEELIEWRVWLVAARPGTGALLVTFVAAVGTAAAWSAGSWPLGAATIALLTAATGEFLFPVRYRITPEYAEAWNPVHWRRIAWREVRTVWIGQSEVRLSPLAHRGPRDAFRGVLLRTGDRWTLDELRAVVARYRGAARGGADGATH